MAFFKKTWIMWLAVMLIIASAANGCGDDDDDDQNDDDNQADDDFGNDDDFNNDDDDDAVADDDTAVDDDTMSDDDDDDDWTILFEDNFNVDTDAWTGGGCDIVDVECTLLDSNALGYCYTGGDLFRADMNGGDAWTPVLLEFDGYSEIRLEFDYFYYFDFLNTTSYFLGYYFNIGMSFSKEVDYPENWESVVEAEETFDDPEELAEGSQHVHFDISHFADMEPSQNFWIILSHELQSSHDPVADVFLVIDNLVIKAR